MLFNQKLTKKYLYLRAKKYLHVYNSPDDLHFNLLFNENKSAEKGFWRNILIDPN